MEREKRQEFVERTKNLLTAAEVQSTEKGQRSTGGSKKRVKHEEEEGFINDTNDLITNTERTQKKRSKRSSENGGERKSSKYD